MKSYIVAIFLVQSLIFSQSMPSFELEDIHGEIQSYENIKGTRLTLIDFWATHCKPCRQSLPAFIKLYKEFNKQGFNIIGINVDSPRSASKVKPFVQSMRVPYTILLDINNEFLEELNVTALPTLFIVDKNDKIVYTHEGFKPGDEVELQEKIKELLNEEGK